MSTGPKLSFIVLVYNYAHYVGQTIRSILADSVQDFEIVVVDDGSTDGSPEVVRSFNDDRIRLFINDQNRGGAWSYNRAVSLAQGEYLVNLDADDWVAPSKSATQLEAFAADPTLDIVGTYIQAVDAEGREHPERDQVERYCNRLLDLNSVESWIVQNPLCRSSTMMRRVSHLRIGLDDPSMTYTCDWELWTRALRGGCRFHVLPEQLTFYRWHGGNITHKNPKAQLLEIAYLMARNVLPTVEQRASYLGFGRMVAWIAEHEQFARLRPAERYRMLASLLSVPRDADFASFSARILSRDPDPEAERAGRLLLALFQHAPSRTAELALHRESQAWERARAEWFVPRIEHLERLVAEYDMLKAEWFQPRIEYLERRLTNADGRGWARRLFRR